MGVAGVGGTHKRVLALHHLPGQLLTDEDLDGEHWYDCAPEWPKPNSGGHRATLSIWKEVAQNALSSGSQMFEKKVNNSSAKTLKLALEKEKTVSDRIAAETLLVQESPLHRLDELYSLLDLAKKKKRRERLSAIEALKDLFINNLLPSDRRLVAFADREFSCAKEAITKRHVMYAFYENELKTISREVMVILDECGRDPLRFMKEIAVKAMAELLIAKPENEATLLAMLVNKLGDPERKISSLASEQLLTLIYDHHPQMRLIVVKEVEQLVLRKNVPQKTQYYAVNFLNQVRFSENDVELARRFLRLFMDLFTLVVVDDEKPKEDPIRKPEKTKIKRVKKKGRIKKVKVKKADALKDTEGSRLIGAILIGVNRAFPYTRPEQDSTDYQAYYSALFRVAHAKSISPATQALAFLLQVSQSQSTQNDRFYRALYSRIYDIPWSAEEKQAAFLNLTYKAMKADTSSKRVKAFMKRLLQAGQLGPPGFAGACILVISESLRENRQGMLRSFVSMGEKDDEDEKFEDLDVSIEKDGDRGSENSQQVQEVPDKIIACYDPSKRDPQFACAEKSSLWELLSLCAHFHPSVSLFANSICKDLATVQYTGDPLKDFAEIAFLDKFSYKKAKNRIAKSLYGKRASLYRQDPLANSPQFQELIQSGSMSEDNEFFARFFKANPHRVMVTQDAKQLASQIAEDERTKTGSASDIDSEEEAFEKAMHAEMRRFGADSELLGDYDTIKAINSDDDDQDELQAFEQAFAEDISINESTEKGEEYEIVPLIDVDGDKDDAYTTDIAERQPKSGLLTSSIFAPAEDFEDAIKAADAVPFSSSLRNNGGRTKGSKKRRRRKGSEREPDSHRDDTALKKLKPQTPATDQSVNKSFTKSKELLSKSASKKTNGHASKRKLVKSKDERSRKKRGQVTIHHN